MAFSYQQLLESDYERIAAEHAMAFAELEAARLNEDEYTARNATKQILTLDLERSALEVRARGFVEKQQAPQGNKYGLSPDELDIARTHAQGDRSMTDEQRQEIYARNKARYQQARRDGSYRDDQGRVFK